MKPYDVYFFTNDEEPEPLCGICFGRGIAAILDMYKTNQQQESHLQSLPDYKWLLNIK